MTWVSCSSTGAVSRENARRKLPPVKWAHDLLFHTRMQRVLALAFLLAASSLSASARCLDCPATPYGADVIVLTTPTMAVNGLRAVITGPVTGTMVCQEVSGVLRCMWPPGIAVVPGSYSLQVSATGYQTSTTQVEVAAESRDMCGCAQDSLTPSSMTLSLSDAGMN
jgi:hypothetical protein